MEKLLPLAALVTSLGCADFHTEFPVPAFALKPRQSVEMDEAGTTLILKYIAPESGDGERDDIAELTCYGPFTTVDKLRFHLEEEGRFYGCGVLFEYSIENDNDGVPSNNTLLFSARLW